MESSKIEFLGIWVNWLVTKIFLYDQSFKSFLWSHVPTWTLLRSSTLPSTGPRKKLKKTKFLILFFFSLKRELYTGKLNYFPECNLKYSKSKVPFIRHQDDDDDGIGAEKERVGLAGPSGGLRGSHPCIQGADGEWGGQILILTCCPERAQEPKGTQEIPSGPCLSFLAARCSDAAVVFPPRLWSFHPWSTPGSKWTWSCAVLEALIAVLIRILLWGGGWTGPFQSSCPSQCTQWLPNAPSDFSKSLRAGCEANPAVPSANIPFPAFCLALWVTSSQNISAEACIPRAVSVSCRWIYRSPLSVIKLSKSNNNAFSVHPFQTVLCSLLIWLNRWSPAPSPCKLFPELLKPQQNLRGINWRQQMFNNFCHLFLHKVLRLMNKTCS